MCDLARLLSNNLAIIEGRASSCVKALRKHFLVDSVDSIEYFYIEYLDHGEYFYIEYLDHSEYFYIGYLDHGEYFYTEYLDHSKYFYMNTFTLSTFALRTVNLIFKFN